jgi:Calcineurin-like phosphoesterase
MRESRIRSRRNFYRKIIQKIILGIIALLLVLAALLGYGLYIEPNWFEVKEISLNLPHLSSAFDGYKVVQLSDIHADRYFRISNLNTIAKTINDQHPDLVVLTGDYVSKGRVKEAVGAIATSFRQIEAKDGILAVLGNHDYWAKAKDVTRELTRYQIKLLKNQLVTINRGSEQFFPVFVFFFFEFYVESASGEDCGILGVEFFDFFEVEEAGAVGEGVEGGDADAVGVLGKHFGWPVGE